MAPAISTTTNRFFCHFGQFLAPNNLKNQNFKTLKKTLEILSFYTIVPKIMIICYTVPEIWCVKDVSVMSFWDFFPFYPPNSLKKENFKKMRKKKPGDVIIYTSAPKIIIIRYTVLEIWCVADVIVIFHLDYFLPFYAPNSPKHKNVKKKMKKKAWRYHHFIHVYQKL